MMQVVAQSLLYCAVAYFRLVLGLILLVTAPFYYSLTAIEWTRRVVTGQQLGAEELDELRLIDQRQAGRGFP